MHCNQCMDDKYRNFFLKKFLILSYTSDVVVNYRHAIPKNTAHLVVHPSTRNRYEKLKG